MGTIYNREQVSPSVCNLRQPLPGDKAKSATGFFLVVENRLYLVSASHVAKELKEDAEIVISDSRSKPIILTWGQLTGSHDVPCWKDHSEADMSIAELSPDKDTLAKLEGRFLPLELFPCDIEPPNRDLVLTSVGFPLGLGTSGHFSPLTFESKASSALLTLDRFDTGTPCTFFILQDPSIGGYSGCPVFDLSVVKVGAITTTGCGTVCYGITHGTISDQTGGKMAAVTPSYYVHDLMEV